MVKEIIRGVRGTRTEFGCDCARALARSRRGAKFFRGTRSELKNLLRSAAALRARAAPTERCRGIPRTSTELRTGIARPATASRRARQGRRALDARSSQGDCSASNRSMRRCTLSRKFERLPNTRARMKAVGAVTARRSLQSWLTCLRGTPIAAAKAPYVRPRAYELLHQDLADRGRRALGCQHGIAHFSRAMPGAPVCGHRRRRAGRPACA